MISKPHHLFADYLGNQRALSNPDEFLGPNWKDVLNFWFYIDTLNEEQWVIATYRYEALDWECRDSVWRLARNAASEVTSRHISNCVYVSLGHVEGTATIELMGAHKILGQGDTLTCVPMFLNL